MRSRHGLRGLHLHPPYWFDFLFRNAMIRALIEIEASYLTPCNSGEVWQDWKGLMARH